MHRHWRRRVLVQVRSCEGWLRNSKKHGSAHTWHGGNSYHNANQRTHHCCAEEHRNARRIHHSCRQGHRDAYWHNHRQRLTDLHRAKRRAVPLQRKWKESVYEEEIGSSRRDRMAWIISILACVVAFLTFISDWSSATSAPQQCVAISMATSRS
jgi:hypothetical protein